MFRSYIELELQVIKFSGKAEYNLSFIFGLVRFSNISNSQILRLSSFSAGFFANSGRYLAY